jgi:hypothetical protein
MSPHVGNFVQDLVEMAKAVEELPKVQEALDIANSTIELYAKQVQEREIAIIGYKEEIERHLSTIRSLEVARDDAELRFLEVEERISHALAHAGSMAAHMGTLMATLDPPKPQPTALPYTDTATADLVEGQSATTPMEPSSTISGGSTTGEASASPSGQSEADPTAMATGTGSEIAPTQNAESSANADTMTPPNPSPGPYFGKRYRDVPGYITIGDWIDGDGTKDDYYAPKTWA